MINRRDGSLINLDQRTVPPVIMSWFGFVNMVFANFTKLAVTFRNNYSDI